MTEKGLDFFGKNGFQINSVVVQISGNFLGLAWLCVLSSFLPSLHICCILSAQACGYTRTMTADDNITPDHHKTIMTKESWFSKLSIIKAKNL